MPKYSKEELEAMANEVLRNRHANGGVGKLQEGAKRTKRRHIKWQIEGERRVHQGRGRKLKRQFEEDVRKLGKLGPASPVRAPLQENDP